MAVNPPAVMIGDADGRNKRTRSHLMRLPDAASALFDRTSFAIKRA